MEMSHFSPKMPFKWRIANAWCLRFKEDSAIVCHPVFQDFTVTDNRQVIKVVDGCAELDCQGNATGIYATFDNGLPRKITQIRCTRNGIPWLLFTDCGDKCVE